MFTSLFSLAEPRKKDCYRLRKKKKKAGIGLHSGRESLSESSSLPSCFGAAGNTDTDGSLFHCLLLHLSFLSLKIAFGIKFLSV